MEQFTDKTLICKDCGREFIFSAGEQSFYAKQSFNTEPARCTACRRIRKEMFDAQKPIFEVVCSKCGVVTTVNFMPRHSVPVYCASCFEKIRKHID